MRFNMKRGVVALASLGLAASGLIVNTPAANAVVPGLNGRIAVERFGQIYILDASGNSIVAPSLPTGTYSYPSWCGTTGTLTAQRNVGGTTQIVKFNVSANNDLTGMQILYNDSQGNATLVQPACSPQGVVAATSPDVGGVWTIAGSNTGASVVLGTVGSAVSDPTWNSSGSEIAFTLTDVGAIASVPAGGGTAQQRTPGGINADDATWLGSNIWFEYDGDRIGRVALGSMNVTDVGDGFDPSALPAGNGLVVVSPDADVLELAGTGLTLTFGGTNDQPDVETAAPIVIPPPAGNCVLDSSHDERNFGSVKKGHSAKKSVVFTNIGSANCDTSSVEVDGKYFSLSSENCPSSLAPGDDCSATVKFAPKKKGTFTGELTVDGIIVDLVGKGK